MLPPPQQMLRIRLAVQYKKNIANFITRLLMLLKGQQDAFSAKGAAAKKVQANGKGGGRR